MSMKKTCHRIFKKETFLFEKNNKCVGFQIKNFKLILQNVQRTNHFM